MSRVWLVACLSAGLLMTGPVRASEELAERARVSGEAIEAFLGGDYARLERVSSAYRADKTRTASGLWKLTFFYIGLANAVDALAGSDGTDAAYDDLIARTDAWSRQYPGSPGACITRSMVHVAHAWYFRGSGFADSVAPEAWEPFEKYIALARQELESHKATASIDPRWYESMLIVARAQGWPRKQFDALLDEALDREPTYYQTYFTALDYLAPKWHGSLEDIEQFALDAQRRTASREGQGMYARIYWSAAQGDFQGDLFSESLARWPRMKSGFDDIVARYPDDWNLNNYAKFACIAHDKQTTRALLKRIGDNVVPEAWSPAELFQTCKDWAASR